MQELKVERKDKNNVKITFVGEDIAFVNAIRDIVSDEEDVEFAAVAQDHIEIGDPILIVKTKKGDPVSIVAKAAAKLSKQAEDLAKNL